MLCFRALEGSNYEVRLEVARLLGTVLAKTQAAPAPTPTQTANQPKLKRTTFEEMCTLLSSGFMRNSGGLFASKPAAWQESLAEVVRASQQPTNREVRVGVAYAYVYLVRSLGSQWLERHYELLFLHFFSLFQQPYLNKSSLSMAGTIFPQSPPLCIPWAPKCISIYFHALRLYSLLSL